MGLFCPLKLLRISLDCEAALPKSLREPPLYRVTHIDQSTAYVRIHQAVSAPTGAALPDP